VAITDAISRNEDVKRKLDRNGDTQLQLRLGMLSIIEQLTEGKKRTRHASHEDTKLHMRNIIHKLQKFVQGNKELQDLFKGKEAEKNYAQYVKPPQHQTRLIRVGTPHQSEDSDAEDDLMDSKVPSRFEIKAKSGRIVNQAMLKRGIR